MVPARLERSAVVLAAIDGKAQRAEVPPHKGALEREQLVPGDGIRGAISARERDWMRGKLRA